MLFRVLAALATARDEEAVCRVLAAGLAQAAACDRGLAVCLVGADGEMWPAALLDSGEGTADRSSARPGSLVRQVLRSKRPYMGPAQGLDCWPLPEGVGQVLALPVRGRTGTRAAAILGRGAGSTFSLAELEICLLLAEQAGLALDNVRLISRLRQTARRLGDQRKQLKEITVGAVRALVAAADSRAPQFRGHSTRVAEYALAIGEEMRLSPQELEDLRYAALLHDIGRTEVDVRILRKRGPLDSGERGAMMAHAAYGAQLLEGIPIFRHLAPAVRHHHEWYAGGGYPDSLSGEEIPLLARILAVADAFDAMTSARPYRGSYHLDEVRERLVAARGIQFCPQVVDAWMAVVERIERENLPLWQEIQTRQSRSARGRRPGQLAPGRILPVHGRELAVVYRVAQETRALLDLDVLLQRILDILHESLGPGHQYIVLLPDEATGDLVVRAVAGYPEEVVGFRVPRGRGVTGWAFRTGQMQVVDDCSQDPRYISVPTGANASEVAIPLVAQEQVIGVLDVGSDTVAAFGEDDLQLLVAVAGHVADYIFVALQHRYATRAAITDGLTAVYNYAYFYARLQDEIARCRRLGTRLSVAFLDFDQLKRVNDRYGHLAGNAVVRAVAESLKARVRAADVVARYGGDEFVIIMPDTGLNEAGQALRRVLEGIPAQVYVREKEVPVPGISWGVAAYPEDGETPEDLLGVADTRMYREKGIDIQD
ncbi:MAG: diguanylate cyclase [Bacillota bacterium]